MAIIHPLRPRMSARTVLLMIAIIWLVSIVIALPNLLWAVTYTWHFSDGSTRTVCYLNWPDGPSPYSNADFWYNVFLMLVNYFVPLFILGVAYGRVGFELWGSPTIGEYTTRQEEIIRSKRKVVKMMMVVVAIFGVCWLPQHVFFLVTNRHQGINDLPYIQHVYLVIYWLAMSNSMYNPIIYCWMNARFRKGFKYVFRWMRCIRYEEVDSLGRPGASIRTSVSEGTRFERNGSMMTTMVESVDETSYAGTHHPPIMHRGFAPMKREAQASENSF